jgi:gliding motility-associated protein GldM
MPGEEIEITAGVGAYSKSSAPVISINGAGVSLGEEGFASYKMTASSVGSHSVPVRISYMNQVTGKQEVLEKNVEYTVAAPGGVSVALEEMNVLYIGWSNKVRIAASGAGDEKVQVSISGGGGSISKTGAGAYIASVTSPTNDCKINVTVDGKTSSFPFRVRDIPSPVATIGGVLSNENMPAGQAKAQTGVGAFIKDFPLDIKYQVVSYRIGADNADGDIIEATVQGNMFNGPALNIIRGLAPGRTLSVDDVRVQGPDGKVRKVGGLTYYIK